MNDFLIAQRIMDDCRICIVSEGKFLYPQKIQNNTTWYIDKEMHIQGVAIIHEGLIIYMMEHEVYATPGHSIYSCIDGVTINGHTIGKLLKATEEPDWAKEGF